MSAIEKKLAYFLKKLPSDTKLVLTEDQKREHRKLRADYELTSLCFKAFCTGQDDPLENLNIPLKKKQLIWEDTQCLICLWSLIQAGFSEIRRQAITADFPFPFETSGELFARAAADRAWHQFSFCLEGYVEISPQKIASSAQDCLNRTPIDEPNKKATGRARGFKTYINGLKQEGTMDWEIFSLVFARKAVDESPRKLKRLQSCLEDHQKALDRSHQTTKTAYQRRGEWAEATQPAYAWSNGRKVYAENGSYRRNSS